MYLKNTRQISQTEFLGPGAYGALRPSEFRLRNLASAPAQFFQTNTRPSELRLKILPRRRHSFSRRTSPRGERLCQRRGKGRAWQGWRGWPTAHKKGNTILLPRWKWGSRQAEGPESARDRNQPIQGIPQQPKQQNLDLTFVKRFFASCLL